MAFKSDRQRKAVMCRLNLRQARKPGVDRPKPYIDTVKGRADYIITEVEDKDGRWNDIYKTRDGYWVIHDGRYHHVYEVNR